MSLFVNFQAGSYAAGSRWTRPVDPFAPIKILVRISLVLLSIIALLAVLGIIIYFIGFAVNAEESGLGQVYFIKADILFSNIPLTNILYTFARDAIRVQQNPEVIITESGWRTEIDRNSENKDIGLKFTEKFSPEKSIYGLNEKVVLNTFVQVLSFKENPYVSFSCTITNGYPEGKIFQITKPDQQLIQLPRGEKKEFPVSCEISGDLPFTISSESLEAKKVRLDATFSTITKSYIPVYTMEKAYLNALKEDPFLNIKDSLLDRTARKTISKSENGPMAIGIKFDQKQPLTEDIEFSSDDTYALSIRIQKKSLADVVGRLKKINRVVFYLQKSFQLIDEKGIFSEAEIEAKDFPDNEEDQSSFFNKYILKQEEIDRLNNQCSVYEGGYRSENCDYLFERGFILAEAKFKVNLDKITLNQKTVQTSVDYDYQSEITSSFTLVKTV